MIRCELNQLATIYKIDVQPSKVPSSIMFQSIQISSFDNIKQRLEHRISIYQRSYDHLMMELTSFETRYNRCIDKKNSNLEFFIHKTKRDIHYIKMMTRSCNRDLERLGFQRIELIH
jgi:hypothetical protein